MSTLETRIAEVVSEHIPNQSIGTSTGGAGGGSGFRTCACGHRATVEYAELAPDGHDTTPLLNRKLADHIAAALAPVITSSNAAAWHQGRESVALDMLKPMGDDLQRPVTPNPYRSNDE